MKEEVLIINYDVEAMIDAQNEEYRWDSDIQEGDAVDLSACCVMYPGH
jgi:hypothetical protein